MDAVGIFIYERYNNFKILNQFIMRTSSEMSSMNTNIKNNLDKMRTPRDSTLNKKYLVFMKQFYDWSQVYLNKYSNLCQFFNLKIDELDKIIL